MKIEIKKTTMKTFPLPVTLVSCIDKNGNPNIITITYITGVNEDPPMIGIAIRRDKHSNKLIKETKQFVVNVPTKNILGKIDFCGTHSGRNVNKFHETGLTIEKPNKIGSPLIKECPINIECELEKTIELPSHDLFIGKVVALNIDEKYLIDNMPNFSELNFLFTTYLDYREIGKKIGTAFEENKKLNINLNSGNSLE